MKTKKTAERPTDDPGLIRRAAARAWRPINAREREFWALVVGMLFADFALTVYGFQLGLVERNPLARELVAAFGVPSILALKGGALAVAAAVRTVMPDEYGAMIPIVLATSWGYAVVANTVLIAILVV